MQRYTIEKSCDWRWSDSLLCIFQLWPRWFEEEFGLLFLLNLRRISGRVSCRRLHILSTLYGTRTVYRIQSIKILEYRVPKAKSASQESPKEYILFWITILLLHTYDIYLYLACRACFTSNHGFTSVFQVLPVSCGNWFSVTNVTQEPLEYKFTRVRKLGRRREGNSESHIFLLPWQGNRYLVHKHLEYLDISLEQIICFEHVCIYL